MTNKKMNNVEILLSKLDKGKLSDFIRKFFQNASDRNSYREGVGLLRKLINDGGKSEADNIIVEQKSRTPRRPALIDELSKL